MSVRMIPLAVDRAAYPEWPDKFQRAQTLLRHAVPTGDAAEIFDRALTLLVESLERRRFAETRRASFANSHNRATT